MSCRQYFPRAELKIDVQRAMLKAEEEVKNTDALVAIMSKQRAEAEVEKDGAAKVADKAAAASAAAAAVEKEAEKELAEAKPALERAKAAVAGLVRLWRRIFVHGLASALVSPLYPPAGQSLSHGDEELQQAPEGC